MAGKRPARGSSSNDAGRSAPGIDSDLLDELARGIGDPANHATLIRQIEAVPLLLDELHRLRAENETLKSTIQEHVSSASAPLENGPATSSLRKVNDQRSKRATAEFDHPPTKRAKNEASHTNHVPGVRDIDALAATPHPQTRPKPEPYIATPASGSRRGMAAPSAIMGESRAIYEVPPGWKTNPKSGGYRKLLDRNVYKHALEYCEVNGGYVVDSDNEEVH